MHHPTTTVANTILKRAFQEKIPVSPIKLQRILFFTASEYHKRTGVPLFNELFQPSETGPILPSIDEQFKSYGDQPIQKFAKDALKRSQYFSNPNSPIVETLTLIWESTKHRPLAQLIMGTSITLDTYPKRHISEKDLAEESKYTRFLT